MSRRAREFFNVDPEGPAWRNAANVVAIVVFAVLVAAFCVGAAMSFWASARAGRI